ncbi:MAG: hypothetical protein ACRDPZ_13550 [Gaiellaceae bacterium]
MCLPAPTTVSSTRSSPSSGARARTRVRRHGIEWLYEPHTFVLERSADGTLREAFTPDFFLPELGVYVECTVMRQARTHRKRRKAVKARERNGVSVEILFRRDFERLATRWQLPALARAASTSATTGFRRCETGNARE